MTTRGYRCLQSPEEGVRVTGACELPDLVLGTDFGSSVDTLWNPNC